MQEKGNIFCDILLIISCSKSKLSHPAPSRYFYTGQFFQKAIKFAKKNNIDVKIISAKYGILELDDLVNPYNIKLKHKRNINRLKSIVIPKLRSIQERYKKIIVIMGKNYRTVIESLFDDDKYIVLIDSRGIGGYNNIISNLLKTPTNKVMEEILRIKEQLEGVNIDIEYQILNALKEKKIFIGYMMLCRYLNNRGYVRYGCNAGYIKGKTHGNERLHPCSILCPHAKYSLGKIKYYIKKLQKEGEIFMNQRLFYDSRNPDSKTTEHKVDFFTIIASSENIYRKYIGLNTLENYLEA